MNRDRRTDEELLTARAPGNAGETFEAFYRRHERLVVAFHVRRVRDPELAAELTAETFAQALASRHRFGARGRGSALRWLFGIAFNVLATSARQADRQRRVREALQVEVPSLDDAALARIEDAGTDARVLEALEQLPGDQREAVRGYVLEEQDYERIAAVTGATQATVRKRVSRGLAALRREAEENA